MNRFKEFLQFNNKCPICNNQLTLYAQVLRSTCFKTELSNDSEFIHMKPFRIKGELSDNEEMLIKDDGHLQFRDVHTSQKLNIKQDQMYFFYLCNENGFMTKGSVDDYNISIYKGCYYRSSQLFNLNKSDNSKEWVLGDSELDDFINKTENFSISTKDSSLEKIFTLQFDYEINKTTFYYYTATADQRRMKDFSPSIFEKTFDQLMNNLDFSISNREKLINKLNNWVIFS